MYLFIKVKVIAYSFRRDLRPTTNYVFIYNLPFFHSFSSFKKDPSFHLNYSFSGERGWNWFKIVWSVDL